MPAETHDEQLEQKLESYRLVCGCAETREVCATLIPLLQELADFDSATSGPDLMERCCKAAGITIGAYYMIIEALEQVCDCDSGRPMDIVWHGSSARFPTLGPKGHELLREMKTYLERGREATDI